MLSSIKTNDYLIYKNDDEIPYGLRPSLIRENMHDIKYGGVGININQNYDKNIPNCIWQDNNKIGAISMTNKYIYQDKHFGNLKPFEHSKKTPVPVRTNYTTPKYNIYW